MMAINKNFTIKIDLDEANDIRDALQNALNDLLMLPNRTVDQNHRAGRIETMLRRDFGKAE
jgi:hypothetical protein